MKASELEIISPPFGAVMPTRAFNMTISGSYAPSCSGSLSWFLMVTFRGVMESFKLSKFAVTDHATLAVVVNQESVLWCPPDIPHALSLSASCDGNIVASSSPHLVWIASETKVSATKTVRWRYPF